MSETTPTRSHAGRIPFRFLCALVAFWPALAAAAPDGAGTGEGRSERTRIAREVLSPTGLELVPKVEWLAGRLVVTGPGGLYDARRFEAGSAIGWAGRTGETGEAPADGIYRYELLLEVSGSGKSAGPDAWAAPAAGPARRLVRSWGEFVVRQGLLGAPDPADPPGASATAETTRPRETTAGQREPEPVPRAVEHHFGGDIGTAAQICANCSPGFEPGDEPLHLIGSEPGIRFQNAESNPTLLWEVDVTTTDRFVIEDSDGTDIVSIEEGAPASSLHVGSNGSVGIGTSTPGLTELDILASDFSASIRLRTATQDWYAQATGGNGFRVGEVIGGGSSQTGPFQIRPGAADSLMVLQSNTVLLTGDVSLGSSRSLKHGLEAVSPEAALAGLLELPLYRWRYREDRHQAEHLGPMAEDVHAAFGLGHDDRHLSPADTSGLALAAIQGLHGKLETELGRMSEENQRLRRENAGLAARLAAIERALAAEASDPAN